MPLTRSEKSRRNWPSRRVAALALILPLAWTALAPRARADAEADLKVPTDQWDALLGKYVHKDGGVDYVGFKKEEAALKAFIGAYAAIDLKGASDDLKKAALINLYNATMIENLLRHVEAEKIDVASPTFLALEINKIKVPGGNIWNGDYKAKLSGLDVSLDDIEHNLIRGKGDGAFEALKVKVLDPRIHAAVNCAALSCPRVRETAYRTGTVDRMLTENITEFMSSEAQFSKVKDGQMKANQIVYWYYDDFETTGKKAGGGAGTWLAQFVAATAKDAAWKTTHLKETFSDRSKVGLKLSSAYEFFYDWRPNDARNRK